MPQQIVNTSDLELRASRESLLNGLIGALDAKRPTAWCQYGYPTEVRFDQLMTAYQRGGPGHGAVHRLLDKCWQERPRIKNPADDQETKWEKAVDKVLSGIQAWKKLRDFDRRNLVGRYAGLIYRVADSKLLREPLVRASKLVDIVPVFENQLRVTEWHGDETDADNFGKPKMFQYQTRDPRLSDTQAQPEQWVDVHPSRVQILAEGSVGNMFEGVPLLLAGYNHLVDLEKIAGGSAEGFLKNSARQISIAFDKDATPQVITQNADGTPSGKGVRDVLNDQMRALNRNIDAAIVTQGATAQPLQTQMADPQHPFEVAANLFAASVQIPFTILFGQQTGRLASDEDKADMLTRCVSRQINELTPMLEEFVKRMQDCGVIEKGEFEIEWPPLDAPGDDEKYAQLGKLTAAMQQAQQAGIAEPLFDANELRGVAGFEERANDGMPTEGDPAGDPAADPAIAPAPPPRPRAVA